MNQKLSKLLRNPVGVLRNRMTRLIQYLRYAEKDGYRAEKYWRDRHGKYGFDLRGVGDYTMTIEENQRILDEGERLVLELARLAGVDIQSAAMLDVGCGTGFYAGVFRRAGIRSYTGIDIVDTLFDGLRAKFPGFRFEEVDVSAKQIPGSYDLIIMMDVAQHISNEEKWRYAMENLKSHLNPGGTIIISTIIGPYHRHQYYVVERPLTMYEEVFNEFHVLETRPFCGNTMFSMKRR